MRHLIFFYLFLMCYVNSFAIDPKKEYIDNPSNHNLKYEEFFINFDDIKLNSWLVSSNNRNLIILSYADYGNMSYYLSYIKFYKELGFDVLSFDYRGFGKSTEFIINTDMLLYKEFVCDLEEVIKYAKQNFNYDKISVLGLSMGSIISCFVSNNKDVDFLILDGFVSNINEVVKRLNDKDIEVPKKIHEEFINKIININKKVLIIVGDKDKITTIDDAYSVILNKTNFIKIFPFDGNHLHFIKSNFDKFLFNAHIKWLLNKN